MNVHAYARLESDVERQVFRGHVEGTKEVLLGEATFRFDGLAGQRELIQTINQAKPDTLIIFNRASDAGRNLHGAIQTIICLLTLGANVRVLEYDFEIVNSAECKATLMLRALNNAIELYSRRARKIGMETARASGAQIGRPAGKTLADVQESIETLMNANAGKLPSVRVFAKEAGISTGKAATLLKQYREQQTAETKP